MCAGEENAVMCWNCQYISTCNPSKRPMSDCCNFRPLGRFITHQHIADWIGISRQHLHNVINNYGINKVIELLEVRGHTVRFEVVNCYVKFFEIVNDDCEVSD